MAPASPSRTWRCRSWPGSTTTCWAAQGRTQTILCATSGDTGGAAVEAFRGARNVKVVALFPEGRISEVQRRFMTTAAETNVACVAVKGSFDDCQAIVKHAFQDQSLRQAVDLSGVNSINFARIAAQAVYYFTTAAALGAPAPQGRLRGAVGQFRRRLRRLRRPPHGPADRPGSWSPPMPTTSWPRTFETGRYARGKVQPTMSPAMDIQSASNFERLYFEGVEREAAETARAFTAFAESGAIDVPPKAYAAMRELFRGVAVSEDDTARAIVAHAERDRRARSTRTPPWRWPPCAAPDLDGPRRGDVHGPRRQVPRGRGQGQRRYAGPAARRRRPGRAPRTLRPPAGGGRDHQGLRPRLRGRLSRSHRDRPRSTRLATASASSAIPMPGLQTVALSVVAGRGARAEDEARSGWSHLLEHMVFKGAGGRSAREIVEVIEAAGRQHQRRHRL